VTHGVCNSLVAVAYPKSHLRREMHDTLRGAQVADELENAYRSEVWNPALSHLREQKQGIRAARVELSSSSVKVRTCPLRAVHCMLWLSNVRRRHILQAAAHGLMNHVLFVVHAEKGCPRYTLVYQQFEEIYG